MRLEHLKRRLGKLQSENLIRIQLKDGTEETFDWSEMVDVFHSTIERMKAKYHGEELPAPHPFLDALLNATDESLANLRSERGWMGLALAEEPITRGWVSRAEMIARAASGSPMTRSEIEERRRTA